MVPHYCEGGITKKPGGISSIKLIRVDRIERVSCEGLFCSINDIELRGGFTFTEYRFVEDSAEYRETIKTDRGVTIVQHKLTFVLKDAENYCLAELMADPQYGYVALVTTNTDKCFVVGYSDFFGLTRPLRFSESSVSTGKKISDNFTETITLLSQDLEKSKEYKN